MALAVVGSKLYGKLLDVEWGCLFVVEDPLIYDFLASDACLLYSDKVCMI